jgi:hypothetical protein
VTRFCATPRCFCLELFVCSKPAPLPVHRPSPYPTVNLASPAILRTVRYGVGPRSFFSAAVAASIRRSGISYLRPQARTFSSTIMVAEKIDGTAIARCIRERINKDIAERQSINSRFKPSLTIVQGRPSSLSHFLEKVLLTVCLDCSWKSVGFQYVIHFGPCRYFISLCFTGVSSPE